MKIFKIIYLALIIFSLTNCSKESHDLQKSIFITDPDNPDLPVYSEWGYNTFGAYYDRSAFVSNNYDVPLKVIVNNDTCKFTFNGNYGGNTYYSTEKLKIELFFTNFKPTHYNELLSLHETTIDLNSNDYGINIYRDGDKLSCQVLNGNFEFKRTQNLIVDKKEAEVILSGTFEISAIIDGEPTNISNGRFDLGVSNNNFFAY